MLRNVSTLEELSLYELVCSLNKISRLPLLQGSIALEAILVLSLRAAGKIHSPSHFFAMVVWLSIHQYTNPLNSVL